MKHANRRIRMQKSVLKLSIGIIRQNFVLSIGLLGLYIVLTALCIGANFSYSCISGSIFNFMDEYCLPDAVCYTGALPLPYLDGKLPEGVAAIEACVTMDVHVKDKNDNTTFISLITKEKDGFRETHLVETADTPSGAIPIWLTERYASSNGIHAGDFVTVRCATGEKECFVEALVSRPESMFCTRNEFSWYDASEYGYLYMDRDDLEAAFSIPRLANTWAVLFHDSLDENEQADAFHQLEQVFGGELQSSILMSEYLKTMKINDDLAKVKAISVYIPLLVFAIGLCFSSLFIRLIFQRQRKNVGFLLALGFKVRSVMNVFLSYSLLITLTGIAVGSGLGFYLVHFTGQVSKRLYGLPRMISAQDPSSFIICLGCLLGVCVISCASCIKKLTGVDPAEAFQDVVQDKPMVIPRWVTRLKQTPIFKYSTALAFKNKKRLIAASISVASCIMLMIFGFSYASSNAATAPSVFGDRLRYDYMVQHKESDTYLTAAEEISGVEKAEPIIAFKSEIDDDGATETNLQFNAIADDSTLIVLKDVNGNRIVPGDGIVLDEMLAKTMRVSQGDSVSVKGISLRVTGIARERANAIQYISMETARLLGYALPNQTVVQCAPDSDKKQIRNDLDAISGFNGIIGITSQEADMKNMDQTVDTLSKVLIALIFALGTILIYIMVIISIAENEKDYAVLNALGIKTSALINITLLENVLMYVISILIGVPLGILASKVILSFMGSVTRYFPLTGIGAASLKASLLALLYLAFGMFFSVYKAVRIDPAVALKS